MGILIRRAGLCLATTAALVLSVSVAPALASSSWWRMLSVSRPTNLRAGVAVDEVQELSAEPASAFELAVGGTAVGLFESYPYVDSGSFTEATAANVQAALEVVYGSGNVLVTGGPAGSGEPLTITSVGEDADKTVAPVQVPLALPSGAAKAQISTEGSADGEIVVTAENVGDATVTGAVPVKLSDVIPPGLRAISISAGVPEGGGSYPAVPLSCSLESSSSGSCTLEGTYENGLHEVLPKAVPPFDQITMRIGVLVEGAETGEENQASISGGPAPAASAEHPITISAKTASFGVEDYELDNEELGGALDAQAGSHPYQQTTTVAFNTSTANVVAAQEAALAKDVTFRWPAGMIGNPVPFARCTMAQFFTKSCPAQSIVGVAANVVDEPGGVGIIDAVVPLYNMEPAPGEAARFGILPANVPVFINATVRTGEDYGVSVHVENIAQFITFLSSQATVWGVPGEPDHDTVRGEGCLREARGEATKKIEEEGYSRCRPLEQADPPPLLTLPSDCSGQPLQTSVEADSWKEPKPFGKQLVFAGVPMPALDGCNRLPFTPSIKVTPDGTAASTPTGLTVDEHIPQESTLDAAGLAEADVKGLSVTMPEGVAINPSSGDGLLACAPGQIALQSPGASTCPDSAKVATVKIKIPVLADPLVGAAYIAAQNENPFGSLLAMYIYAEDPASGVRGKAAGEVLVDPVSGQLTAHFEEDPVFKADPETWQYLPQAPIEDVELHFFGGERAPLATPAHCGVFTTTGTFTPWSAPATEPGTPISSSPATVSESSKFEITSGPHGTACPPASLPFSPLLTGGTININAGGFTPLVTTIGREDGEQNIGAVTLHMPEGVEGLLSGVKLCPEAEANAGSCGPESLIGETIVSAGVGAEPVAVKGGRVYLTEQYAGAPFGLSIVNPVKAGPFDLEHDTANPASNDPACDCLVVRAKVEVNPASGELTVTTDPSGPHAIPHVIDGIPVQIKRVNVTVSREHFTFNPTSCEPLALTGSITSDENISEPLSVPFHVSNCSLLGFGIKAQVSTAGQASKANGAGLRFKIAYPKNAMGHESWLDEAKFTIPNKLPARLGTLQKACLAVTFEHDREACPAASKIGHAIVHTQVLPVPLEGPVYFVSYGSAKFPDVVLVLKGYGVTIEQHGETFISKDSVTSATFRGIPDVPFESLEVDIPTGPFSEFGVNLPEKDHDNFCGQKLTMPTSFKASNGLQTSVNTPVSITGCKTRAQKLKAALAKCRKKHNRNTRSKCEHAAHKKY